MAEIPRMGLELPAALAVGAIAAAAYLAICTRHRGFQITLLDTLLVVAIMAVATSAAMPFLAEASGQASSTALLQNMQAFRTQIELYRVEHGAAVPLLHEGTLPQLTHPTNAKGVPGPYGKEYPYGPYLPAGIPVNPFTGVSTVTPTETFPPTAVSGNGGWLYHEETGRIAPDLEEYLHK
ncbi:MAG: type II secretion system protein [Planctomycetota bacterium]